jgi:hypothetical protein
MPRITSKPCNSNTIKLVGKLYAPISRLRLQHPKAATNYPPGELIFIGVGMLSVGMLFLSTNTLDMNECDAPVSNRTIAGNLLSKSVPITASGSS